MLNETVPSSEKLSIYKNSWDFLVYSWTRSDRRLLPGPPAKFAAANPSLCRASCVPENPRDNPKSTARLVLEMKETRTISKHIH